MGLRPPPQGTTCSACAPGCRGEAAALPLGRGVVLLARRGHRRTGLSALPLPDTAAAFADATWTDLKPYYEELAERPIDAASVEHWLADWSALDSMVSEAASLANFAYTGNTADPTLEAAQLRFGTEIGPRAH